MRGEIGAAMNFLGSRTHLPSKALKALAEFHNAVKQSEKKRRKTKPATKGMGSTPPPRA